MVQISIFAAVALFSSLAAGLPRPMPQDDSAIGIEVAVSAPDGIPLTNSVELASQSAREAGISTAAPASITLAYGRQAEVKYNVETQAHVTSSPVHVPQNTPVHKVISSPVHDAPPVHKTSSPVHLPPVHTSSPVHIPLPSHGSGGKVWQNHDQYNDCVQQCVATYGSGPGKYAPTATETETGGVKGTGATHTVIVAPSQGVFRYIPFAINATVGDTVKFVWGANNHTVTKGSALQPCNRTADAQSFASGRKDQGFVFHQVVNDTSPTYFFCGVGAHCRSGMFGIINPATNFASPTSLGRQLQSIGQNSSNVEGYSAYTAKQIKGNDAAARWGSSIDIESVPEWAREYVAENVLYTRMFLATNPEVLKDDGSIDLSSNSTVPLAIPEDIAAALNNAGSGDASPSPSPNTPAVSAPVDAPASTPAADNGTISNLRNNSGASSLASPKVLVALAAVFATLLL
ncbi:hypothetical protein FA15DRAFT_186169 [Coprinopsis marcescibilis]|uniref:Phytocyanin domain-containing protein n=1 Tax=Coprinopsis marcescibilis TaxID=230819 RepID=A0A5C3LMF7_COPMA|nr:hypothetical protein FA15DRAFT_186169 [Coprinopsis marcescibilis]